MGKHSDEYVSALNLAGVRPGYTPERAAVATRVPLKASRLDEAAHDSNISFDDAALGNINGFFNR
jgi:hypothetical protein